MDVAPLLFVCPICRFCANAGAKYWITEGKSAFRADLAPIRGNESNFLNMAIGKHWFFVVISDLEQMFEVCELGAIF